MGNKGVCAPANCFAPNYSSEAMFDEAEEFEEGRTQSSSIAINAF